MPNPTPKFRNRTATDAFGWESGATFCVVFLWMIAGSGSWGVNAVLAQTVQLPSVRQFSTTGGVLVPDGGSAFLGGNRSSAWGASSQGIPILPNLPGSRFGSRSSAGGVSASVTIIDLDEMDRRILGENWRQNMKRQAANTRSESERIAEAKSLVRNARRAWNAGQISTARNTYDLAIERLSRLAGPSGELPRQRSSRGSIPSQNRNANDPAYLLAYARAEYSRLFLDSVDPTRMRR